MNSKIITDDKEADEQTVANLIDLKKLIGQNANMNAIIKNDEQKNEMYCHTDRGPFNAILKKQNINVVYATMSLINTG